MLDMMALDGSSRYGRSVAGCRCGSPAPRDRVAKRKTPNANSATAIEMTLVQNSAR
jgi:hypothetical protein